MSVSQIPMLCVEYVDSSSVFKSWLFRIQPGLSLTRTPIFRLDGFNDPNWLLLSRPHQILSGTKYTMASSFPRISASQRHFVDLDMLKAVLIASEMYGCRSSDHNRKECQRALNATLHKLPLLARIDLSARNVEVVVRGMDLQGPKRLR